MESRKARSSSLPLRLVELADSCVEAERRLDGRDCVEGAVGRATRPARPPRSPRDRLRSLLPTLFRLALVDRAATGVGRDFDVCVVCGDHLASDSAATDLAVFVYVCEDALSWREVPQRFRVAWSAACAEGPELACHRPAVAPTGSIEHHVEVPAVPRPKLQGREQEMLRTRRCAHRLMACNPVSESM